MPRRRVAGVAALLVVAALGMPSVMATVRADGSVAPAEARAALETAHAALDNPLERLLIVRLAVVAVEDDPERACDDAFGPAAVGRAYIVEAYAVFAIPATRIRVACNGNSARL